MHHAHDKSKRQHHHHKHDVIERQVGAEADCAEQLAARHTLHTVFAVVVIGGMGSIMGSILTGLGLGVIEGLTRVFYPEASATVVFVIMALVLLVRPAGLFGKEK